MKTTFKWMFAAILLCGLTIASCTKDPQPTPEPEPQTLTFLAREEGRYANSMYSVKSSADYIWENGKLTRVCDTVSMVLATSVTQEKMVYEDDKIVRIEEENGKWEHHFTYEDDLIVNFLSFNRDGDSSLWGTVSYNAEGLVEEIMYHDRVKTTKWSLTWLDGDATVVEENILAPAELAETRVYTYVYDDKPCAYTGFPMAYCIFDGDGNRVATRQSKHNMILEGYTNNYDDNGLLTSIAAENDTIFYHYIEQTVR